MNPFAQRPFVTVGKTNFTTVVMAEQIRQSALQWRDSLSEAWQDAGGAFPVPVLLWLAERGLIAIQLDVQWYPPRRPPYVVRAAVDHSGPFVYRRFLEAFARLQCVLPEWRDSLSGSDWEVPAILRVKRRGRAGDHDTLAIESLAQYDGQNGVTTGKGRSLTEAMAAVQREFTTRINRVEFDGVVAFQKRAQADGDSVPMQWHPEKIQAKEFRRLLEAQEGAIHPNTVTKRIDAETAKGRIRRETPRGKLELRSDLWGELHVNE